MPETTIIFAKVVRKPQQTLDQSDFAHDIQIAIDPDSTTERYGRTWRFSRPKTIEDFLAGKLGFTSPGSTTELYYDEDLKDFMEQPLSSRAGNYAHFVLDLLSQVSAFETKPPDIRLQSFFGAFKDLLDQHHELALTVERIADSQKFYEWVKHVDRVIMFKASLRAPNPDFASRPQSIIELLEKTNADRAAVEVRKEPGSDDGLLTENNMLSDIIKYGEDGYSSVVATGLKNGKSERFDSNRKVASKRLQIPQGANVSAIWQALIDALSRRGQSTH